MTTPSINHLFPRACALSPWLCAKAHDGALFDYLQQHKGIPANTINWSARLIHHTETLIDGDIPKALRRVRQEHLAHSLIRDLDATAPLEEIIDGMSRFADFAITCAHDWAHSSLQERFGILRRESGEPINLQVIGMGKLGGGELNVSSDIDLIFLYPEEGHSDGAVSLSAEEYLSRLGKKLIGALHDINDEGQVFRVDMRLRPHGEAGPLVMSHAALEHYLIREGREWERYAWIKARLILGGQETELSQLVRPFVFRKYLDFSAMESMFDLHRQIREQVEQKSMRGNIKLGRGGIREIEFIAQLMQLMRGGRRPELQQKSTCTILRTLAMTGFMDKAVSERLIAHYHFLRRLEHRLQYRHDQQTQTLPEDFNTLTLIAESMSLSLIEFQKKLAQVQDDISAEFTALFEKDSLPHGGKIQSTSSAILRPLHSEEGIQSQKSDIEGTASAINQCWQAIWNWDLDDERERLASISVGLSTLNCQPQLAQDLVAHGRYSRIRALKGDLRKDHEYLVHHTLQSASLMNRAQSGDRSGDRNGNGPASGEFQSGDYLVRRALELIAHLVRRPSYLRMLRHSKAALSRVERFLSSSSWGAAYLCKHPILLDDLLDPRLFEVGFSRATVSRYLAQALRGDVGERMNVLRECHHAETFRLLAQDLEGLLSVEKLSDHLSDLADEMVSIALQECWHHLAGKISNAPPSPSSPPAPSSPKVAIIAYGKLGGKELGYASDLDLVIVRDDHDESMAVPYAKLAVSLTHWLSAATEAGQLFETDYRLRPDGDAGPLVPTMSAVEHYQRSSAWLWEHQALTRARFCAGDDALGKKFERLRHEILCIKRPIDKLTQDIEDMREKMRQQHKTQAGLFDLKHDVGGLIDIEFIVQWGVLAFSHRHPELTKNLGNIALLIMLGERAILPRELADDCADIYRDWRRAQHQLRLNDREHLSAKEPLVIKQRDSVKALWRYVFG